MMPTESSILYTEPIKIKETTTLRAIPVRGGKSEEEVYTERFIVNKATFKPIRTDVAPHKSYTFGGVQALVDGLKGGDTYNDSKWIGFTEADDNKLKFSIDLIHKMDISSVRLGTYVSTSDWIFGAVGLVVELSEDGKKYKEVVRQSYFEVPRGQPAGRVNIGASFTKAQTRYVRITVAKTRVIPEWHQGRGRTPFIFIDEIDID